MPAGSGRGSRTTNCGPSANYWPAWRLIHPPACWWLAIQSIGHALGPPRIVVDVRFTAWSGAGRVRHPVYLGVRDRPAREVVMEVADPDARRRVFTPRPLAG